MTWLPSLIVREDFESEEDYEEELYRVFMSEWVFGNPATFRDVPIRIRNGTSIDGKDFGFWHLLTGGGNEEDGPLILERCETIRWARALVDNADTSRTCVWEELRNDQASWLISLPDFSYVVVLDQRTGYLLLNTAYPESRRRRREKRRKAYEAYRLQAKN